MDKLIIRGARQHNLKNVNLELPKNKLIVFTGLSGSGKSSMAFDTIYAEGQRRYVESLSSYARQFLGVMDKPDVDSIEGLSPAISIDQKSRSHNPRSTVGTVTEIYDYLRLLFARIGHPHCPNCQREISKQSTQQIVDSVMDLIRSSLQQEKKPYVRFFLLAPIVRDRKGEFSGLLDNLRAKGFRNIRVDGRYVNLDEELILIKTNRHSIDVVVDTMSIDKSYGKRTNAHNQVTQKSPIASRINDAVEQSLELSDGLVIASEIHDASFTVPTKPKKWTDHVFSEKFACPSCNLSLPEIEPRSFSFNSPHGACSQCTGLGTITTVNPQSVINPNLSITEGGILPFAKIFMHDTWYARVITTVAQKYGIDTRAPLGNLNHEQRNILLYGTGNIVHTVHGTNRFGEETRIEETFDGIVTELVNRYKETDSEYAASAIERYMYTQTCPSCSGKRLKKESLTITVDGLSISDISDMSIRGAFEWARDFEKRTCAGNSDYESVVAKPIMKEIDSRLSFLDNVGLDYLTLSRSAQTLSGGEAQRIRLASQIGSGLTGVLYILDEPSIGLHQRDNKRLIRTLEELRNLGNTVIVVEHDREMIESADHLVDFGPGAGKQGGAVVTQGTVGEVKKHPTSITAKFLTGKRTIVRPASVQSKFTPNGDVRLVGARKNNLKNITVAFPLGKLICVSGVSGSGKSSLVVETLYPAIRKSTMGISNHETDLYDAIEGADLIDKVILIDQSPIGRTPRSNPATYTGVFTYIREIFSMLSESKIRGYNPGRFSFNVKSGRCEACEGEGQRKIEMQFLADIYVTCDVCHGNRYNNETLEVTYHNRNIAQVLDMTVDDANDMFHNHPHVAKVLQTIVDVGLGYIHLGQPAPTLSGGEAQRVKLAAELSRKSTGRTLYILDEPTTGLHFADLGKLLHVLGRLTYSGNTVIVIEHNLDILKNADWIIDLGPEGGDDGGHVVAKGTARDVSHNSSSFTGKYLKEVMRPHTRI